MSAQPAAITVPPLNDQQATAILQEAINRKMMDGTMPPDEATRVNWAGQFVAQAAQASVAGNNSEAVQQVLFIAQVDMNPPVAAPVQPPAPAPPAPPVAAPPMQAPAAQQPAEDSFDLSTLSVETMESMIKTLEGPEYVNQPNVQQEIARLNAEITNRSGGQVAQAQQPQAVPPPAQATPPTAPPPTSAFPAATQAPAPGAQILAPASPPVAVPPGPVAQPTGGVAQPGIPPSGFPTPDATANQSPEAAQQGAQGGAPTNPEERKDLESKLTIASLRAHNVALDEVPSLSIETLRAIVENPGGPVDFTTTPTQSSADQPVTSEREQLVEQITGPMLKAYGRGRRDIPGIGDNEIKLMIANPDGTVDPNALAQAREADRAENGDLPTGPPKQLKDQGQPAPVQEPIAAPITQPQPPTQAVQPPAPPAPRPDSPNPVAFSPVAAAAGAPGGGFSLPPQTQQAPAPVAPPVGAAPPVGTGTAHEQAMAIIQRENMPIPPEIDGDPPRLPNDISTVTDAELFSFHARFHACEVRMNWVISEQEDALSDMRKLLRDKKREVRLNMPKEIEGKKVTKDNLEAMIDHDPEVQQYQSQVDELEKIMGKLKVLRDGYHQDVSTCSRQWSMRSGEADKLPR